MINTNSNLNEINVLTRSIQCRDLTSFRNGLARVNQTTIIDKIPKFTIFEKYATEIKAETSKTLHGFRLIFNDIFTSIFILYNIGCILTRIRLIALVLRPGNVL